MVTVGDAQNGKRKTEDVGNPRNFPHTKAYNKHYSGIIASGLLIIVIGVQLLNTALDFWFSEPKQNNGRERKGGRR